MQAHSRSRGIHRLNSSITTAQKGSILESNLRSFDAAAAWHAKVGEMAAIGLEYLVLMAVALDFKTFYPSRLLPAWEMACPDPLEALLQAADDHGIKVFVGNGFWGQWTVRASLPMRRRTRRLDAMEELASQYGHHASFYGWYWANEAGINGHFNQAFIDYAQECSRRARALMPDAPTMIAPYGTNRGKMPNLPVS